MTFRQALHDYLRDAVNVPVHDGRLPTRPMYPTVTIRFISGYSTLTMSAPRSLLERRVQIDAYAMNDPDVDALATAVLRALDGYHGPMGGANIGWSYLLNDLELEPAGLKGDGQIRFHRIMDFAIAYQEVRATPEPILSS